MMKKLLLITIALWPAWVQAFTPGANLGLMQDSAQVKIPFNWYLGWINGQNRQHDFPLTFQDKKGETILT
ncbi:MAG TPA: hypothetical protein VEV16_06650, partial [Daejeonella sp.]|nr:hypothetical protein [Daejeonella sp.]